MDIKLLVESMTTFLGINNANFIWIMFSLLSQGAIAGLIVLYFTEKIKNKNEQRLLKKYCLLNHLETKKHLTLLEIYSTYEVQDQVQKHPIINTHTWDITQHNLVGMQLSDLKRVASYYQIISLFNSLDNPFDDTEIESPAILLNMAKEINSLFLMYCDDKNKAIHKKNHLTYQQIAMSSAQSTTHKS